MKNLQPPPRPKSRLKYYVIALIIVAGLGYYHIDQDDNDQFFNNLPYLSETMEKSVSQETQCQVKMNWHVGTRQMYHIDIVKIDHTYPAALEGHTDTQDSSYALEMHMEISGILNIRVFGKDDMRVYMGCQMSEVVVKAGDSHDKMIRNADLETLFRPFFLVAMGYNGLPEQFYFPPHLDKQSCMSLSEILFAIQTVGPSSKGIARKWRSEEKHALGKFKVEYMVEPHSCKALVKQNLRCIQLHDLDRAMLRTDQFQFRGVVEQSNHQITLSDSNASWISSYAGEETFAIYISQHAVWYRRHMKILLTPNEEQPDPELFIWETEMDVSEIISAFTSHDKKKKRMSETSPISQEDSEKLALSGRLEMFQKDMLANATQEVILKHIQTLKQFLTEFPEESGFIPDLIKNLNISEDIAEHIILVLEMIGHDDAQRALSDIFLDYNQTPDIRQKAAISAGGISSPEPVLIDSLFQLITQEQETPDMDTLNRTDAAILSLGLLNQVTYLADDSVTSNFIHNRLISMLQSYSDERHVLACIKALGNSKMPKGADDLFQYVNSDSPLIRKTAIQAIGNLNPDKSLTENNPDIFSETETASPETLTNNVSVRLINLYYQADDPDIRKEMIKAVIKRKEPVSVELLEEVLNEDSDEQVADMIHHYLRSYLQLH